MKVVVGLDEASKLFKAQLLAVGFFKLRWRVRPSVGQYHARVHTPDEHEASQELIDF